MKIPSSGSVITLGFLTFTRVLQFQRGLLSKLGKLPKHIQFSDVPLNDSEKIFEKPNESRCSTLYQSSSCVYIVISRGLCDGDLMIKIFIVIQNQYFSSNDTQTQFRNTPKTKKICFSPKVSIQPRRPKSDSALPEVTRAQFLKKYGCMLVTATASFLGLKQIFLIYSVFQSFFQVCTNLRALKRSKKLFPRSLQSILSRFPVLENELLLVLSR